MRDRYDKAIEVIFPDAAAVQDMVRTHGMNLFYESLEKRQLCCRLRKVEPRRRFLAELDAYVTGLRRAQNVTRAEARKLEIDESQGGILKINPIVDWSGDRVLRYVREHDVPMNRLHAEGFPTVGCAPCTRAVAAGEDPRAGRWWWRAPRPASAVSIRGRSPRAPASRATAAPRNRTASGPTPRGVNRARAPFDTRVGPEPPEATMDARSKNIACALAAAAVLLVAPAAFAADSTAPASDVGAGVCRERPSLPASVEALARFQARLQAEAAAAGRTRRSC